MQDIRGIRRRTWAEININNLEHNYNTVRQAINSDTKLCCVIKANAYGHGAIELAHIYSRMGADYLAISNVEEALQLRENGITLPLLILGYTPPECASILADENITQCVYSIEYARILNSYADAANVKIKIHIKIDTGMGRIGFVCRPECHDELSYALEACQLKHLIPEGIFTHFAVADEGENGQTYTRLQYQSFMYAVNYLEQSGIEFEIRHCANSATIFDYPEFQLDMVRAGIVLYGLNPSSQINKLPVLKPAMSLKTIISHIKCITQGESTSYGRLFIANGSTRVATLPIGYADGLDRLNTGYKVSIGNSVAPIIGRICMDQLMIDVTGIECDIGDVVTIFGNNANCSADAIAHHSGTINYEVVCGVGERVPRAYIKGEELVGWRDTIYKH